MTRLKARTRNRGALGTVIRMGVLRGVLGGSKGWLYLGAGAWALRLVGRLGGRKPVVHVEKLNAGERVLITHFKRNQV